MQTPYPEDTIQRRLEESSWSEESWQEDEEMWPIEFRLGE
jgi:hypothetical protein